MGHVFHVHTVRGMKNVWYVTVESFTRAQIGGSHVSLPSQVALVIKNLPASAGDVRDKISNPGWGRSPGGGHILLPPVLLPGESHGKRRLAGYSP